MVSDQQEYEYTETAWAGLEEAEKRYAEADRLFALVQDPTMKERAAQERQQAATKSGLVRTRWELERVAHLEQSDSFMRGVVRRAREMEQRLIAEEVAAKDARGDVADDPTA